MITLRRCHAVLALALLPLLAGCPPPYGIIPPLPAPEPLPALVPDPLAASGPGNVAVRAVLNIPVLALGSSADLTAPAHYGQPALDVPLGLYPVATQRPVRQQAFSGSSWASADPSQGQYAYDVQFADVPLGSYNARVAWWIYDFYENYAETLSGPEFALTADSPSAVQQLELGRMRGTGKVPGRLLLPPTSGETSLRVYYGTPDGSSGDQLEYSFSSGATPVDGRLFFELQQAALGGYDCSTTMGGDRVTLSEIPFEAGEGLVLNEGPWPEFQIWPRRPQDNMFFGFLRLTGAQTWAGDLRLTVRPAGSDPDAAPLTWVWLDSASNNTSGEIYGYVPWYPYYKAAYPDWPPPGIGFGLAPLPEGHYDIYAELHGPLAGQHLSIRLAQDEALPPASKSDPRLFRDDRSKGAPWWVATPLELNLSAEQASAFAR